MERTLRLALAQVATSARCEDNVIRALRMMVDAAQAGAQLIVFPEMSVEEDDVTLLLADLDLDLVEKARRDMPFLRDRRPETYGFLVEL